MPTTKKKDDLLEQQNQVPNTTQQTAPAQSSTVQQAQTMLQQQMKNGYQSQWQPQINNLMEQYMNRDEFSYDVNKDALFQQLRDQYKLMGQQAMMDTMGQATALTGGYGNSYAQGVGQQAYQGFMQQLGDKMPDLYQLALDQYINEGSKMQGDIAMMMQQDSLDYGRYRDQMADQDEAYNKLVALMTNYHYEPTAEEMAAAGMPEAHKNAIMKPYYDMLAEQAAASSGNSSDYDSIIETQQKLKDAGYDITVDGVWSQETQDAWNMYQAGIGPSGGPTEFTGSTYSEAVSYMKNNGVNPDQAAGILKADEWRRAKASGSPRYGANEFSSYSEYLQYAVDANIAAKEKE